MQFQIAGFTLGILLIILGVAELLPALLDYAVKNPNENAFFLSAFISVFIGSVLVFSNRNFPKVIRVRDAFVLTTVSWCGMSLFAALPLYLSHLELTFTDAFFEAVSGITTTGSTILSGLDHMSHGVLLWRSMSQWIGGIGIIAFAIVFLPFLRIGGMQLFQTESSDRSEKIMPRTSSIVLSLFEMYCLLTLICFVAYHALGMDWFDAVNHALTTLSTGGFSTHDASFGYFENPALHYVASFFMFAGGIPFILYIKLAYRRQFAFFKDEQFKATLAMLTAFILVMTIWLFSNSDFGFWGSLRLSLFNVISIVTTTGYATADYLLWGPFAVTFFFFLTYLGACAGSTTGGLKVMRLVIVSKAVGRYFKTLLYPNGVFTMRYQGRPVERYVVLTVLGFLCLYVAANTFLTMALALTGLDFPTAVSGAATALANVGPGVGDFIGPAGNFEALPDTSKWLLCLGMLLGRLEILTVVVLFSTDFWGEG